MARPLWIWLLLIVVLLSLVVLIVLLLLWSRRRKAAASKAAQLRDLPAKPAQAAAKETAVEAVAVVEEPAKEAVVEMGETAIEAAQETAAPMADRMPEAAPIEQPPPDDLKIIEGIGPKISGVLQAAGITTLAHLAASDVDELRRILTEAHIRLGDPSTWPEQAGLAAEAKWDELTALQASLKGGRRV